MNIQPLDHIHINPDYINSFKDEASFVAHCHETTGFPIDRIQAEWRKLHPAIEISAPDRLPTDHEGME